MADAAENRDLKTVESLGAEIRALRKVKGMTLIEFAEKTGKSIGYLSQVERDITKPSAGVLQEISTALGVEIGWFFPTGDDVEPREQRYIVRARNRRRIAYSDLGYTDYLGMSDYLLSTGVDGAMAMGLTNLEPEGSTGDDNYTHQGEEAGYVLDGSVELTIDGETFILASGDSYSFPSTLPHRFYNPGNIRAVFIWCITPIDLRPDYVTSEG
ncbi:MAG: cupin domain-containing protein [Alphaproteobacteria bacterium]|nr:cupin domain-containing protein [Rhodospirillaceae bacterium]MDG2481373.1 cupin domain-containing protein [Alphaproteobacteria bacterium]MBT6203496.1 cupin domain-containing protein [Rhodospirillaceae bacterium]MBT6509590.1 cupin domain-containing protein [Rhodospirillaceae bacterium]MBT7611626.1 cupin domain-containing protein [Rhodospirillaceae bacterium]